MKCLIVADKSGWSYEQIAFALQKHNTDPDLQIDMMALKGNVDEFLAREKEYDRVLIMGHQMLEMIPRWEKVIECDCWLTGVHSHHSFDPKLITTPEFDAPPPKATLKTLREFRSVNVVSERLYNLFHFHSSLPIFNVAYTPNGVDTHIFRPYKPFGYSHERKSLTVGFAGTAKGIHDKRKGLREFAIPACEKAGMELVTAVARTETALPPSAMPAFHNSYDIFLLPSSSEGFSIALLEAASSGRLCISTRVGGSTELIQDGVNGFLVDRSVEAIVEKLLWVRGHRDDAAEMAAWMRKDVIANWSWKVRAPAWYNFIRS